MRTTTIVAALIAVMSTGAAFAQEAGKTQISLATSNVSFGRSNHGSEWSGGIAVALARAWSPRWSTELSVAAERHQALFTHFEVLPLEPLGSIVPVTAPRSFKVFPVDLTTQYRFANSSRWTPYILGGVRYVAAPAGDNVTAGVPTPNGFKAVNGGFRFDGDRTSAELGAGTLLRLTPHFALRFDAISLLRSDEVNYDRRMRASVGISWTFR